MSKLTTPLSVGKELNNLESLQGFLQNQNGKAFIPKVKRQQPLTEERKKIILESLNCIYLNLFCADAEYNTYISDTNFKNPLIHNKCNRIMGDIVDIMKLLKVEINNEDEATDRMAELHQAIKFLAGADTSDIRSFNTQVEQMMHNEMKVA